MRIVLKNFQEENVAKLARYMRDAARDSRRGDLQSVALSSTTGSGKTVMVTRAIELLLQGDGDNAPIPGATFLWITDQPELNEQTRKKMLSTSSVLNLDTLRTIDASFDDEALQGGLVYFVNIQKLGKERPLVTPGDGRSHSIWEIIENTIAARPGKFFVIIDEAHRGMREARGELEAATIIQKFIKGSPGELSPVPVVVGISATPDRFNKLIVGTGRMYRPVDVDPGEVRKSGLIKDTIILHHPTREQPTDMTMLREAARSLKKFTSSWASYCAGQDEFAVFPLLVVQVEDASYKGQISETDLAAAIAMLRYEMGNLPTDAFAHAFQEGASLQVAGEAVRYIAPSEIQSDRDARIVFFKTSLNTGWDCPRAEVMMSFRAATDSTNIAQLVGRMVRTPLARRIVNDEILNTVALYLPHYDRKGLAAIVERLSNPDSGTASIDIVDSKTVLDLQRAAKSESAFQALAFVPSYVVPRRRKANQVRRVMKLARLLTNDGLYESALWKARKVLLAALNSEYSAKKSTARFRELVDQRAVIEIEAVNWDVGSELTHDGEVLQIDVASENIDDLFEASGRKLNEGLHMLWWRERVKNAPKDRERAKLELFALCVDPDVVRKVEYAAQSLVQQWLKVHQVAISMLDEGSRAGYDEIRSLAAQPEVVSIVYPALIQGVKAGQSWTKHLYVGTDNLYYENFRPEERAILDGELKSREVVAWLRNTDRKSWAFCVPYEVNGEARPMYPDFLIVRRRKTTLLVDIVDPHSIHLSDAAAKAAGLAKFAAQHSDKFGRIDMILLDGKTSKRLDLTKETVRMRVAGLQAPDELRRLFLES
ncbi:MAG TPA: DEAD/DEAH box helicase family protein [Candidatus Elarobacter sp.]|jgi:type III restriction enzyme